MTTVGAGAPRADDTLTPEEAAVAVAMADADGLPIRDGVYADSEVTAYARRARAAIAALDAHRATLQPTRDGRHRACSVCGRVSSNYYEGEGCWFEGHCKGQMRAVASEAR